MEKPSAPSLSHQADFRVSTKLPMKPSCAGAMCRANETALRKPCLSMSPSAGNCEIDFERGGLIHEFPIWPCQRLEPGRYRHQIGGLAAAAHVAGLMDGHPHQDTGPAQV